MNAGLAIFLFVILAVEAWYWLWWLPRNWKTNRECVVFYEVMTGKRVNHNPHAIRPQVVDKSNHL